MELGVLFVVVRMVQFEMRAMSKLATAIKVCSLVVMLTVLNGWAYADGRVSPVMGQLYKIKLHLQVHYLDNGVLPLRLAELEERYSVDLEQSRVGIIDPWGKAVEYSRSENGSCYALRVVRGERVWSLEGCVEDNPRMK